MKLNLIKILSLTPVLLSTASCGMQGVVGDYMIADSVGMKYQPKVKPSDTMKFTDDWVVELTTYEKDALVSKSKSNADFWGKWMATLARQPIQGHEDNPEQTSLSFQIIEEAQIYCNNIYNYAYDYQDSTKIDLNTWGVRNYFATPNEFKEKGVGDCEDFAICKYYYLRENGFSPEQVNLWAGYHVESGIGHSVVSVELMGEEYVLDVPISSPVRADFYMNRYFKPVYRFNEIGMSYF